MKRTPKPTPTSLAIHSAIGASSMHRWANCPGSVKLSKGIKSQSSTHAEEGTLAHDYAAKYVQNLIGLADIPDEEMREAVKLYADTIEEDMGKRGDLKTSSGLWVEHRFDLNHLHKGLYGTADAVVYHHETRKLIVYDFKYGQGVVVEAEENEQCLYYAVGALTTLNLTPLEVEIVIVQPRCYHPDGHVRRWTPTHIRVLDFISDLVEAAGRTEGENPPRLPGDWCRWCPAIGICPELHQDSMAIATNEFSPMAYDPKVLADVLKAIPMIESWAKGVKSFAYRQAQEGKEIPGWKLVEKRSTRRWIRGDEAISSTLLERHGLTDPEITTKKLKSPAQIEKMIPKKERDAEGFEDLVVKVSTGLVLVPICDKRKAIIPGPEHDFEVIEEGDEE